MFFHIVTAGCDIPSNVNVASFNSPPTGFVGIPGAGGPVAFRNNLRIIIIFQRGSPHAVSSVPLPFAAKGAAANMPDKPEK